MLTAATYHAGKLVKEAGGDPFLPADFNPWADRPPITLEEAMRTWQ